MKKNSDRQNFTSTKTLRFNKKLLEEFLQLQNQEATEEDISSLHEAIRELPISEEKKSVLFRFFDPALEQEVDYFKMEDQIRAIIKDLPDAPESARFRTLLWTQNNKALATAIGAAGWARSNATLRDQWEKEKDRPALSAVYNALEAVHGPFEDPGGIPEEWVRKGAFEVQRSGKHMLTQGSGKHRTTSDEERREQARKRKADFDENARKARQELRETILCEKINLPRKITKDPAKRIAAYEEIEDRLLAQWCSSTETAQRHAGEKEKVLILQQRKLSNT